MIKVGIQFFGGRGSASAPDDAAPPMVAKNSGMSLDDAIQDYWSTGWGGAGGKGNIANAILGEGKYKNPDKMIKEREQELASAYNTLLDNAEKWPDNESIQRTLARYNREGRNTPEGRHKAAIEDLNKNVEENTNVAVRDVAHRMGYNLKFVSSETMSSYPYETSTLKRQLGAKNYDQIKKAVVASARQAKDAHKRR